MKKHIILSIVLSAAITAAISFSSCSAGQSSYYENSDKYTAGNAEITDIVEEISIDWASGNVDIKPSEDGIIRIEEKNDIGDENKRVHWYIDGTTLRIKYSASGDIDIFDITPTEKNLTVSIPSEILLDKLEITASSADINCTDIYAAETDISTSSGEAHYKADSTVNDIDISSSSGRINIEAQTVNKLEASSSSGNITVYATAVSQMDIDSSSGKVSVTLDNTPTECDIETSSGETVLTLPKSASFSATIDSSSGNFNSDFALMQNGNTYISRDGNGIITIESSSGDIKILSKE